MIDERDEGPDLLDDILGINTNSSSNSLLDMGSDPPYKFFPIPFKPLV